MHIDVSTHVCISMLQLRMGAGSFSQRHSEVAYVGQRYKAVQLLNLLVIIHNMEVSTCKVHGSPDLQQAQSYLIPHFHQPPPQQTGCASEADDSQGSNLNLKTVSSPDCDCHPSIVVGELKT